MVVQDGTLNLATDLPVHQVGVVFVLQTNDMVQNGNTLPTQCAGIIQVYLPPTAQHGAFMPLSLAYRHKCLVIDGVEKLRLGCKTNSLRLHRVTRQLKEHTQT